MKHVAEVTAEELAKRRTCSVCGGKKGHNKRTCTNEPASTKPKVQAAPKEKAAPKQQASQPKRSGLRSKSAYLLSLYREVEVAFGIVEVWSVILNHEERFRHRLSGVGNVDLCKSAMEVKCSCAEHPIVTFPLRPDFGGVTDGTRAKNPSSLSDIHARVFPDPYLLFRLGGLRYGSDVGIPGADVEGMRDVSEKELPSKASENEYPSAGARAVGELCLEEGVNIGSILTQDRVLETVSFKEMITSQLQGKLWLYDEVRTRLCFLSSSNRGRLLEFLN
ncbi:hypothetical protein Tco_0569134 [Tanacetum coccineum]